MAAAHPAGSGRRRWRRRRCALPHMRCAALHDVLRCPTCKSPIHCRPRVDPCPRAEQECGDFKRGACFRATCKFLHGGKPASEVAGAGMPHRARTPD